MINECSIADQMDLIARESATSSSNQHGKEAVHSNPPLRIWAGVAGGGWVGRNCDSRSKLSIEQSVLYRPLRFHLAFIGSDRGGVSGDANRSSWPALALKNYRLEVFSNQRLFTRCFAAVSP